jgi:hypothetical protein
LQRCKRGIDGFIKQLGVARSALEKTFAIHEGEAPTSATTPAERWAANCANTHTKLRVRCWPLESLVELFALHARQCF